MYESSLIKRIYWEKKEISKKDKDSSDDGTPHVHNHEHEEENKD